MATDSGKSHGSYGVSGVMTRARICKRLRSSEIGSEESIPPGSESIPGLFKRFPFTGSGPPCLIAMFTGSDDQRHQTCDPARLPAQLAGRWRQIN